MATNFCEKCKAEHPGRTCDFSEGECAETNAGNITLEMLQDAYAQTLEPTLHQLSDEACGYVPENDPATIDLRFTTNDDGETDSE